MTTRPIADASAALALLAGIALWSGSAQAAAPKPAGGCEAAAAIKFIGAEPPDDAIARSLTGAKTVRRVAPGQSVSLDYRPDRLTLEIADGQVVSTSCG